MGVPLFDLTRQNNALMEDLLAASERVIRSGRFVLGEEVAALEAEAAALLGADGALAVSSGTDALLLALMACGIGPGDEVIVPDFTFFATAGCVARLGARPVFADVCPLCFNVLPESVEARITGRTRAILPVHLFGQPADMAAIRNLAEAHDLRVIEDCAQSIGAKHRGETAGSIGDFGAISFFPTKNLGGFGDGGLLLARSREDLRRAEVLRVHGMEPKYFHPMIGGNFRMDALQAAMLRVKLPHLDAYNRARRANAAFYLAALGEHAEVSVPSCENGGCPRESCRGGCPDDGARILLPHAYPHNEVTWNQFTVRVPGEGRRDAFREHLAARGIGSEIYYPVPLSRQECFRHGDGPASSSPGVRGTALHRARPDATEERGDHRARPDATGCPNARMVAGECVSLPVFPELTEEERAAVVDAILDWLAFR